MLQAVSILSRSPSSPPSIEGRTYGAEAYSARSRDVDSDRVDLSDQATQSIGPTPAPRTNLIDSIRDRIAAGTYLSDEKIDQTVERIMDEVLQR